MSARYSGNEGRHPDARRQDWNDRGSPLVFGAFWVILFFSTLMVAGPWAGFHGILLGSVGVLMWLCPPVVSLPRSWWILAAAFVILGAAPFLPAGWFPTPEWRRQLELLGVETGPMVAIQARQAAEAFLLFGIMLATGLWLAGHRSSPSQLRCWALAFTLGVAVYAVFSRIMQNPQFAGQTGGEAHFGFFPNRNHTGTYLAMGTISGLGCVFQALRDKRFVILGIALAATAVCMWAVAGWSVSRGGVVLVAIGCLAWLPMLGRRYLGKHGLWAVALMALTAIGLFFIADTAVKRRISSTVEKVGSVIEPTITSTLDAEKPAMDSSGNLDFRIPTALDTLDLIREFKWTGIGAGQYYYVFPQYKKRTAVANDADSYHPESDWLWMAAEAGIPATLALAALVLLAFRKSLSGILAGRDRALRGACLVAAMLVPVHGLFDVPGHRITLAWCAVLLYALSLQYPPENFSTPRLRVWPCRTAAVSMVIVAVFLIRAQWWGGRQPATITAKAALTEARRLYADDQTMKSKAEAGGVPYQPNPDMDPLEKALATLREAAPAAPLNRDLLRYQAYLALHFDDKSELIDQCFAVERTLDPTWVSGPLRQAEAWAAMDPQRSAMLWTEALRRAGQLDRKTSGMRGATEQARQRIRQFVQGKPDLERLFPARE